jgi:hypothetical protein
MQEICYKCKLIIDHTAVKHGLHSECYKNWFDPNHDSSKLNERAIEEFSNIIPRKTNLEIRSSKSNINSSFFQGTFKKYSGSVYGKDYLLKTRTNEYNELPKSEYLCNQIAECLNLDIAQYYLIKYPEQSDCFVTYNFMQDYIGSNLVHIYHFIKTDEEFNIGNLFKIIEEKTGKYVELKKFIKLCLFDALIGNHDRHGRNIGFIQSSSNYILSPCYDNPSYLAIADDDFLGTDLNPRGKIYTSTTKEPVMADYINEFIRLGYKVEVQEFFKIISLEKIQNLIEESFISQKRKQAFINLITKRYMEFKDAA